MKRTRLMIIGVGAAAVFAVLALRHAPRARATSWPWIEVEETSHRNYHVEGGGFTPNHTVMVGAYRPAPGPPPVPYVNNGQGHWFAGHKFTTSDANGEISMDFSVSTNTACNQMLPFVDCDNQESGGCLNFQGTLGTNRAITDQPSYQFLTCP
jgi:hypothetical protein